VKRKQQHPGESFLIYLLGGCLQAYQATRCFTRSRHLSIPSSDRGVVFLVSQAFLITITGETSEHRAVRHLKQQLNEHASMALANSQRTKPPGCVFRMARSSCFRRALYGYMELVRGSRDGSSISTKLGSLTKKPHLPLSKDFDKSFLSSNYHRSSYRVSISSIFCLSSRTILQTKRRVSCHRLSQSSSCTSPSTDIQIAEIPSVIHQTSPPTSSPSTAILCHSRRDVAFRRSSNTLLNPLAPLIT
jgi:hypothetical protein